MKITSPIFDNNGLVPTPYTCNGLNINPPLEIHDVPKETKSFVLVVLDMSVTPSPWIHWFVYNIPPSTTRIAEGSIPSGATEGYANGGKPGYEGPCPRYFKGTHRYLFSIYALNSTLDIDPTSTFYDVQESLGKYIIDQAELVGIAEGTGEKAPQD